MKSIFSKPKTNSITSKETNMIISLEDILSVEKFFQGKVIYNQNVYLNSFCFCFVKFLFLDNSNSCHVFFWIYIVSFTHQWFGIHFQ